MLKNKFYLKKLLIVLIIIGLLSIILGIYQNKFIDENYINNLFKFSPEIFHMKPSFYQLKIINNEFLSSFLKKAHDRPYIGFYMTVFFFTGISLGALFFLIIQYISQARWAIILSKIIEGITSFIPFGMIFIFFILLLNGVGFLHIFHWMNHPLSENGIYYDPIIFNKKKYLNIPFYLFRGFLYIFILIFFTLWIKSISNKLYLTNSLNEYKYLYIISIIFISFFSIILIMIGWDWVMSIDPHWISTLFGWYVLSTNLVCGITVTVIFAVFFKEKGLIPLFNNHHLHDLTKYIFTTSLIWTYLWFSQFLLYWYGNIPEEISYFLQRTNQYGNIHLILIIPNFIFPFIGLISSKAKKKTKIVITIGFIILIGHIIDIYNIIIPSSLDCFYGFGLYEIGNLLLIGSLFIFIISKNINKILLLPNGNPFCIESSIIY